MIPASIDADGCTSELISARSWADGSMLRSFERQSILGTPICITADAIMFCVPLQKCVEKEIPACGIGPPSDLPQTVRRKILIRSMSVEQGAAQATGSVETVVIRPMQPVFMSADKSGQIRVKVERPPTS